MDSTCSLEHVIMYKGATEACVIAMWIPICLSPFTFMASPFLVCNIEYVVSACFKKVAGSHTLANMARDFLE